MTMRLDTITKLFAERKLSRRAAFQRGSVGLAAAAGALTLGRATAQEATPEVTIQALDPDNLHPQAADAAPDPEFLFVQSFAGGTWAPKTGKEGVYTLTLTGASANTVYFSDRPQRIFGLSPTQDFLDGLGFTPTNPPNAALVAQGEDGAEELLVIQLLNPVYDDGAGTLTYDALVLAAYSDHGLAHAAARQTGFELAESFGHGGLFIDDCQNGCGHCYSIVNGEEQIVGHLSSVGFCYHFPSCQPCNSDGKSSYYGKLCAEAHPDQCFYGTDGSYDCYAHVYALDDVRCL